MYVVYEVFQQ